MCPPFSLLEEDRIAIIELLLVHTKSLNDLIRIISKRVAKLCK